MKKFLAPTLIAVLETGQNICQTSGLVTFKTCLSCQKVACPEFLTNPFIQKTQNHYVLQTVNNFIFNMSINCDLTNKLF